jgi:hypothetical protein
VEWQTYEKYLEWRHYFYNRIEEGSIEFFPIGLLGDPDLVNYYTFLCCEILIPRFRPYGSEPFFGIYFMEAYPFTPQGDWIIWPPNYSFSPEEAIDEFEQVGYIWEEKYLPEKEIQQILNGDFTIDDIKKYNIDDSLLKSYWIARQIRKQDDIPDKYSHPLGVLSYNITTIYNENPPHELISPLLLPYECLGRDEKGSILKIKDHRKGYKRFFPISVVDNTVEYLIYFNHSIKNIIHAKKNDNIGTYIADLLDYTGINIFTCNQNIGIYIYVNHEHKNIHNKLSNVLMNGLKYRGYEATLNSENNIELTMGENIVIFFVELHIWPDILLPNIKDSHRIF